MKKVFLAMAVAGLAASQASGALLLYEPFNYSTGALLGQTNSSNGRTWLRAGVSVAPSAITVVAGSLTPPTPLQPAVGNSLNLNGIGDNSGSAERLSLDSTASPGAFPSSGSVFYSMVLRVNALTGSNNGIGGFLLALNNTGNSSQATNPTAAGARIQSRIDPTDATKFNIGVFSNRTAASGDAAWSGPLTVGTDIFIVGAYDIVGTTPGTDDTARLWINPSVSDFGSPTPPTADRTDTGGTDLASGGAAFIGSVIVRQSPAPQLNLDELRIGTSFADVTSVPEPISIAGLGLTGYCLLTRRKRR